MNNLATQAKAFAERHRDARKLSGTILGDFSMPERPIRKIRRAATQQAATQTERQNGVCSRCGARLAFGCEHHPAQPLQSQRKSA